jgi:hypothetical protein
MKRNEATLGQQSKSKYFELLEFKRDLGFPKGKKVYSKK